MKIIPYGKHHITDEDIAAVVETLRSNNLTQGPKINEFERKFADYVGARYAVAVSNATAGLHISVEALKSVNKNSEPMRVIVTPMTFAASANCVRYCGGEVEFCDIDPRTYLMDTAKLERMLESAPAGHYSGIVVVDFAGYPHKMEEVRRIADRFGVWVIEDACHAPGAEWTDSKGVRHLTGSGAWADCTVFSFHPVKHIATGEGGMVVTDNETLYCKLQFYRTHGIERDPELMSRNDGGWYYEMQGLGFNYRLTDIQAALGLSQLERAAKGLERRREIARRYDEAFAGIEGITIPWRDKDSAHAFHLYVIQVPDRKKVYDRLREHGIYAQVHYVPVHMMPYYKALGSKEGNLPVVEEYYCHCLSLPMYPTLTDEEQDYVIRQVIDAVNVTQQHQ